MWLCSRPYSIFVIETDSIFYRHYPMFYRHYRLLGVLSIFYVAVIIQKNRQVSFLLFDYRETIETLLANPISIETFNTLGQRLRAPVNYHRMVSRQRFKASLFAEPYLKTFSIIHNKNRLYHKKFVESSVIWCPGGESNTRPRITKPMFYH